MITIDSPVCDEFGLVGRPACRLGGRQASGQASRKAARQEGMMELPIVRKHMSQLYWYVFASTYPHMHGQSDRRTGG